jgi:hypothetical protein
MLIDRNLGGKKTLCYKWRERLFGLVVRVSGYRSRGREFDSWRYQMFS